MILYHGSADKVVRPAFGLGNDHHDYGRGFYLTGDVELAKEWSVCKPNESVGYVHAFDLDLANLKILDFTKLDILAWLAELMKHRDASDSKRYRMLSAKFIEKYGVDSSEYDVIIGWRANASYFYIAREFVRDNIDVEILEKLLLLGDLGIQYCVKSEKAYSALREMTNELITVDYSEFNLRYNKRDEDARANMKKLIDSDENRVTRVFSTLLED